MLSNPACSRAPRHIRPSESLGRRLLWSVLTAAIVYTLLALTQTQAAAPSAGNSTPSGRSQLGAPCSTLTDIKEGTCNLKVDKIKRNAGQPKPFTNN